jgi:hypothetical protein
VTGAYDRLVVALEALGQKPLDGAARDIKKRFSERMSEACAAVFADELRRRGLKETRPGGEGNRLSGAERRISGGIGAKRIDVSWATEESGLQLAFSVKCINFRDRGNGNFQKNLTNRRSDMLFEAVTLHRRYPYAVLGGFLLLDKDAETDGSDRRNSTFYNVHRQLRLFTGRVDPAGRDEQYERLYVGLVDASPTKASAKFFLAGEPETPIALDDAFDELVGLVAERNPDFYEAVDGLIAPVESAGKKRARSISMTSDRCGDPSVLLANVQPATTRTLSWH